MRDASALTGGVVPGAVSIPEAQFAGAKDQFPKQKSAPVILYGSSDPEKAFAAVRGWCYKNASISAGALKGALLIPLADLGSRLGEVPKDKKLVALSSTGARAEMA